MSTMLMRFFAFVTIASALTAAPVEILPPELRGAVQPQVIEYLVQPQEFTMLRTGGAECEMQVDGVIFQGGRRWVVPGKGGKNTQNFIRHVFPQSYPKA